MPVFSDKHLAANWADARWMYDRARELMFPFMAGSSIPVTWRRPALRLPRNCELTEAVAVGYGPFEGYGFHALEGLQCMVERRRGGETGVRAVTCLQGEAMWQALDRGVFARDLLDAAMAQVPEHAPGDFRKLTLKKGNEAGVFLIEYRDGFRAAVAMLNGWVHEGDGGGFSFAGRLRGEARPAACQFYLQQPDPFAHFAYLLKAIDAMMQTGHAAYPVERTLLDDRHPRRGDDQQGGKEPPRRDAAAGDPLSTDRVGLRDRPGAADDQAVRIVIMFDIKCPNCERQLQLPEEASAHEYKCPICHVVFTRPWPENFTTYPGSSSDEGITDGAVTRLKFVDEDAEVDVLAKRARSVDEDLGKLDQERAREFRWTQSRATGYYGFFCGMIVGVIWLCITPNGNKISPAGIGALGGALGFVITFLAHTPTSRDPFWIQGVFVVILGVCVFGVMFFQLQTTAEVDFSALVYGGILGLVVVPLAWVMIAGLFAIAHWFYRTEMENP